MKKTSTTLHAYLDQELSASRREEFERQLTRNPDLKREFEELQSLSEGLQQQPLPEIGTPESAWQDVQRQLRVNAPGQASRYSGRTVGAWGSLAAAAALSLLIWNPLSSPSVRPARVEYVDSYVPESVPVVYTDPASGWTVVWLSNANLESNDEIR